MLFLCVPLVKVKRWNISPLSEEHKKEKKKGIDFILMGCELVHYIWVIIWWQEHFTQYYLQASISNFNNLFCRNTSTSAQSCTYWHVCFSLVCRSENSWQSMYTKLGNVNEVMIRPSQGILSSGLKEWTKSLPAISLSNVKASHKTIALWSR